MGKKRTVKSFAELEMENYAQAKPDIHEDNGEHILRIFKKHVNEIAAAKKKYLKDKNYDQYGRYGDIEAAFYILAEDLKREGFEFEL